MLFPGQSRSPVLMSPSVFRCVLSDSFTLASLSNDPHFEEKVADIIQLMRSSSFRMSPVFIALFTLFASTFRTRTALQAEIAALRHQIAVLQLSAPRRLRLKQSDRFLWILWSWVWPE